MSVTSSLSCLFLCLWSLARSAYSFNLRTQYLKEALDPVAQNFAVGALPNVTFQMPTSWAGQLAVPGRGDDKLFFWLFQSEKPSADLIIWLNGGPGCSSLDGLTKENGPISFPGHSALPASNQYSWTKLANVLYIDQPVGTGFSGGSVQASMNVQVTQDFVSWLQAFYDVFPVLRTARLHVTGESYAGVYLPYFTKALLDNNDTFPLDVRSVTIGDGTIGNLAAQSDMSASTYLHQQASTLTIPQTILDAFDAADQQCGFDSVIAQLGYPPKGNPRIQGNPEGENYYKSRHRSHRGKEIVKRQDYCFQQNPNTPALVNLSINDPCYGGCATWSTALDYLAHKQDCFNLYNIGYNCLNSPDATLFANWLNQPATKAAIHAPARKTYTMCNATIMLTLESEYVQPPTYFILPDILAAGIEVHMYSGDLDLIIDHYGTEYVIQNMTWNGAQGFQKQPNKAFTVNGQKVGNWGAERGLSYHHILKAGHAVPYDVPATAFAFMRDFVLSFTGYSTG